MSKNNLRTKLILGRLNRVYCRLKPSPIHGVGIFAIKPIPKGTNPFKDSYQAQNAILINKRKIPEQYTDLLQDYHPTDDNNQVLSDYPNQIIWTNYLNYVNEGMEPNIQLMENGEWLTLRDISEGEELLEDPKRLFNEDGSHKVFIVKPG